MSDDFQVGDVVVCISDDYERASGPESWWPKRGQIYRVAGLDHCLNGLFLEFAEDPDFGDTELGWAATDFRKLPKADEQFTEQMRAIRPHTKRVPA